ncbi:unnamed protein product [Cuscuta campestris]|uniref:Uncharacterized protein n=1 Tax=Cuscuta campestris TaxID=132261 RepID=A0A484M479_9ASTE|nr:unnamed protein product [Cuscuta campestris]
MVAISSLSQFPCRPIAGIRQPQLYTPNAAVFPSKSTGFHSMVAPAMSSPNRGFVSPKGKVFSRAFGEDAFGDEEETPGGVAVAVAED